MYRQNIIEFFSKLSNVISSFGFIDLLDIILVAFVIYQVIKFLRETRAFQLVKGLLLVLVLYFAIKLFNMQASSYIFETLFSNIFFVLVILFQPEIRHTLESAGRSGFKKFSSIGGKNEEKNRAKSVERMIEQFVLSATDMSEKKIGSLTVFERNTLLGDFIKTGTVIDAAASEQMFSNVFYPKAPLHDGAAIVRDGRIYAAGCILPLTENNNVSKELGTRHRAAIGMSEQCDALIVVTSEETGVISVVEKGNIRRNLTADELRESLKNSLENNIIGKRNDDRPTFWQELKGRWGDSKNEQK